MVQIGRNAFAFFAAVQERCEITAVSPVHVDEEPVAFFRPQGEDFLQRVEYSFFRRSHYVDDGQYR